MKEIKQFKTPQKNGKEGKNRRNKQGEEKTQTCICPTPVSGVEDVDGAFLLVKKAPDKNFKHSILRS